MELSNKKIIFNLFTWKQLEGYPFLISQLGSYLCEVKSYHFCLYFFTITFFFFLNFCSTTLFGESDNFIVLYS